MAQDNGLKGSMWANRSHFHTPRHFDPRSRSVPPQYSQQHTSTYDPTTSTPLQPAAPNPTLASSRTPLAPAQALHRLEQTCLRLRWKSLDLETSWQRTVPETALAHGFDEQVAERNFKLDFYEFYSWIEQALVLLQRIFGVEIVGSGSGGGRGLHAYHHNVLTALGDEENPLHGTLGKGDVNQALWKAKDLRNKWKDAVGDVESPPTRMYDLRWILGKILAGLEAAYILATERVHAEGTQATEEQQGQEADWEWMVEDQMEWES